MHLLKQKGHVKIYTEVRIFQVLFPSWIITAVFSSNFLFKNFVFYYKNIPLNKIKGSAPKYSNMNLSSKYESSFTKSEKIT